MDVITIEELRDFLTTWPGWGVSLFMPTHRAGRETEQDPIRLKNLLRQAEEGLVAKGVRSADARRMLAPAEDLLQEPLFWRERSDGLALFISSDTFRRYRLPLSFDELVVVSHRFHLKPLLPFFAQDGHFYILALSQNQVTLLEGTAHSVDEVDVGGMLPSLAEAMRYDSFQRQLQFHTGTSSVTRTGDRAAVFHGHDPSDEEKDRVRRWLNKMDSELPGALMGKKPPLVLAGVDYVVALYREVSTYPHIVEESILGNPEEQKPEALHAQAWPIAQRVFMKAQEDAAAQYSRLAGTGLATARVEEAVLAAQQGRVDVLFVALGLQIWGRVDADTGTVYVHESPEAGDEDLLNVAAVHVLLNGGTVYAVDAERVPAPSPLAAVFRY